jgi:hypothetical protein
MPTLSCSKGPTYKTSRSSSRSLVGPVHFWGRPVFLANLRVLQLLPTTQTEIQDEKLKSLQNSRRYSPHTKFSPIHKRRRSMMPIESEPHTSRLILAVRHLGYEEIHGRMQAHNGRHRRNPRQLGIDLHHHRPVLEDTTSSMRPKPHLHNGHTRAQRQRKEHTKHGST